MAEETLFNRLTKLFRSGPTIKRKVRTYTKADKNASSAVELFKKHHSDVYNTTLSAYGTFDRMARYSDFSEMESTPELASALDIYAEETVSQDAEGRVLHIYSDNRIVKELLETLFYDTLNIDFNLVMWVRNLCKYGDFFLFNDVHPEYGVINAYPIPITEIEREEGYDADDPSAVRFRWITQGNQTLENWQITHFRLLGNDAFLPYGSSVLESARRIWRQLILIEDAMLVYRVIRAPERRVFYIDVGNVPPEDIATYVEQAKTSLKRDSVVNKTTGQVDLRYNPMAVDEDYFIPVRGGDSGTRIDNLAGGQNASAIEDVQYVQKKLFAALKIPKAYLGYDEDTGAKATLAQEDVRFSRTIQRIQKTVIAELNKLAMIHLYSHGFEGEELLNFSLSLSNPSSLAQQQKLELIKTKFDIAGSAPEGMVSKTWLYKNVFSFTKNQIELIQKQKMKEKLDDAALEAAGSAGGEEGGDAGGDAGGMGGLFSGDKPEGPLLNNLAADNFRESEAVVGDLIDEDEDEDIDFVYDKIDNYKIQPEKSVKKNVFGEPLKTSRKREKKETLSPGKLSGMNMVSVTSNRNTTKEFLKNPFGNIYGENLRLADSILGFDQEEEEEDTYIGYRPVMDYSIQRMFEKMNSKFGVKKLIKENKDEEFEIDIDLEDQDD